MLSIGVAALLSGLVAQVVKVVIGLVRQGRFNFALVFSSGGMPSSHTAVVTTLALLVGEREGIGSHLFSVVIIFSLYVILEATGLRQEVGKQAALLNDLVDDLITTRHLNRHRLRELVGHTWGEVGGGFICGFLVYLLLRTQSL
ncbi:MAG: divergent PAP2 family protein [bacterium]